MMAGRFATLLAHETRMQFRYGIYFAYAFVIAFYIAIFFVFGADLPGWAAGFIIYSDPAVLGFFFLGALMMLEKSEGVRTALAITPVSPAEYIWAKSLPLTALAVVAVALLSLFVHTDTNLMMLLLAVVLTSLHFLGLGVPTALHFRSVTSYLIGAAGFLTPIVAPAFIALFDDMPWWAIIIPSASQLRLILIATGARAGTAGEILAMFIVAALATALAFWFAIHQLEKELGRK